MTTVVPDLDQLLDDLFQQFQVPRATYRLQFNPSFTFQDAQAIVPYLNRLGISEVYTSPLYKPRAGSTHGYDTVDYNTFNPALGTYDDFETLVSEVKRYDMGLLLDIVPNHMGISKDNPWWMDVLKHGPSSVYSYYFDIDWQPKNRALDNKVLLPVLGDHYGRILENGELQLVYWHGDFYLHYYDNQYPVTPDAYVDILTQAYHHLTESADDAYAEEELQSIITALRHLPPYYTTDKTKLREMRREQKIARRRFVTLHDSSEAFRDALDAALETINGTAGDRDSFDLLDTILERQPYRLSYWRVASDEINYRRFFNINDMAAIRIEHPEVFQDTHRLTFQLIGERKISGLRIDHPDGLWNPKFYLQQLQEEYLVARLRHHLPEDEIDRDVIRERLVQLESEYQPSQWPLYVLVEKILSETEPLPFDWAVHGTTGYDFMMVVNNLYVDPINEDAFNTIYQRFIGEEADFHEIVAASKHFTMSESLNSELYTRSAQLADIVEQNRRYRGFTRHNIEKALMAITSALPIYRTYITDEEPITERDRHYIHEAVEIAKARTPRLQSYLFDFVRDTLMLENLDKFDDGLHDDIREFVMQYQQMTGPVMAKSMEDTAFYIYNRLTSLNEVGGHPNMFGITVQEFHNHHLNRPYPNSMLSTSTHDTKRSEDVRARINVLSEMPDEWEGALTTWARMNYPAKTRINAEMLAPAPNDEYLLYQTMLGAYPLAEDEDDIEQFTTRLQDYMHKAINEAKVHSDWIYPNDAYHQGVRDFIAHILQDKAFIESFKPFQERVSFFGFVNSLSQTLIKLTVPGVPDIYQGNELWRYSLVDPDNRRPVDYDNRQAMLDDLLARHENDRDALLADLIARPETGAIKLYATCTTLNFRRDHPTLFARGSYIPINGKGAKSQHICAYMRRHEDQEIIGAVPRLVVGLTDGQTRMPLGAETWSDTVLKLPPVHATRYRDILTDEVYTINADSDELAVATLLRRLPFAILQAE
jgi:(1->4)-alpha-D-glucan 1-alpha-D-glucosylmutase